MSNETTTKTSEQLFAEENPCANDPGQTDLSAFRKQAKKWEMEQREPDLDPDY
jgi:hypothetical protein|tara:strand:- start:17634 stop:17792 length:159 start_codon:yes stop_codon:yes gene_type:complete